MFTDEIKKAIDCCISHNIPFAVYSFPGENDMFFFANPSASEENKAHFDERTEFIVSFFNNDYPYTVGIKPEMTAVELLQIAATLETKASPEISPWTRDTEYLQYCSQAHQIINDLKRVGGKTVLSRVITGKITRKCSDVIEEYFNANIEAFCYSYMTQETGCWLGATPEILYEHKLGNSYFETMSLAGTRLSSMHNYPWDYKNIEEHNYVTEYISSTLLNLGYDVYVGNEETIQYGTIEHLCHRINAKINNGKTVDLLNRLSPTPAVAGYPLEYALDDIMHYEAHPRYCYAGYVGIADKKGLHIYVNLRCAHFNSERFCIYGGGGLTELSIEEDEWQEVELKTAVLRRILTETNNVSHGNNR